MIGQLPAEIIAERLLCQAREEFPSEFTERITARETGKGAPHLARIGREQRGKIRRDKSREAFEGGQPCDLAEIGTVFGARKTVLKRFGNAGDDIMESGTMGNIHAKPRNIALEVRAPGRKRDLHEQPETSQQNRVIELASKRLLGGNGRKRRDVFSLLTVRDRSLDPFPRFRIRQQAEPDMSQDALPKAG